jgi:hypothetical protein
MSHFHLHSMPFNAFSYTSFNIFCWLRFCVSKHYSLYLVLISLLFLCPFRGILSEWKHGLSYQLLPTMCNLWLVFVFLSSTCICCPSVPYIPWFDSSVVQTQELTLTLYIGHIRVGVLFTWWRRQTPVSETSCVFITDRRWIMSTKCVILTTHHRHKPSELTSFLFVSGFSKVLKCWIIFKCYM